MRSASKQFRCGVFLITFVFMLMLTYPSAGPRMFILNNLPAVMYRRNDVEIPYDEFTPLIFVGGVPRSGTTLMRAMLDAHPDVRCGEETQLVPQLLAARAYFGKKEFFDSKLAKVGISKDMLDSATRASIIEIIARHGDATKHLCNKDPFTQINCVYLKRIFPNAKFLFMIRDGRATVHSLISRNVSIAGFDLKNYQQSFWMWNQIMKKMRSECINVGPESCMPVYYEKLVLQPAKWMRNVADFLGIPWNESMLHHEKYIGTAGGVSITKSEPSADQVIKPINIASLYSWVGQIPQGIVEAMPKLAPMLKTLGYDPLANPPDYGEPDARVANNTKHIEENSDYWRRRAGQIAAYNPLKNLTQEKSVYNEESKTKM